ncbi:hypothetical protein GMES_0382 [Paraglaciecola mesophila KMM 241]|uniref:Uncharacterized protein n=1 Tax=Paraglaciecola mesophila KMM 241 TaxID=1128912 RepID=K6YFB6_9ALTE|nr:hypothetical protein GMES_0382 [Paraglaciecola mesophila KMM 241]
MGDALTFYYLLLIAYFNRPIFSYSSSYSILPSFIVLTQVVNAYLPVGTYAQH